jgi:hypothetical protein
VSYGLLLFNIHNIGQVSILLIEFCNSHTQESACQNLASCCSDVAFITFPHCEYFKISSIFAFGSDITLFFSSTIFFHAGVFNIFCNQVGVAEFNQIISVSSIFVCKITGLLKVIHAVLLYVHNVGSHHCLLQSLFASCTTKLQSAFTLCTIQVCHVSVHVLRTNILQGCGLSLLHILLIASTLLL